MRSHTGDIYILCAVSDMVPHHPLTLISMKQQVTTVI